MGDDADDDDIRASVLFPLGVGVVVAPLAAGAVVFVVIVGLAVRFTVRAIVNNAYIRSRRSHRQLWLLLLLLLLLLLQGKRVLSGIEDPTASLRDIALQLALDILVHSNKENWSLFTAKTCLLSPEVSILDSVLDPFSFFRSESESLSSFRFFADRSLSLG